MSSFNTSIEEAPVVLISMLVLCTVGTILFALGAPDIQKSLAFGPKPMNIEDVPSEAILHLERTDDGEELAILEYPPFEPDEDKPETIEIFFHGNAGNLNSCHYTLSSARGLDKENRIGRENNRVYTIDYRGFGMSSGTPTEPGLYVDGITTLRFVERRHPDVPRHRIMLHGYSMGCAVAIFVCASHFRTLFRGLMLEAPFRRLTSAATHAIPILTSVTSLMDDTFPNTQHIQKVTKTPLLVVHGKEDEIIPFADGSDVLDACPTQHKQFLVSRRDFHAGPHADERAYHWFTELEHHRKSD